MHTIKDRFINWVRSFFDFRTISAIMAIIILIAGGITLEKTSITVVKTAVNLFVINDNIQFYNESYIKTDKSTERALEQYQIRQERFYESDDAVVRTYSNMFVLWKGLFFLLALAAIFLIPVVCVCKIWAQILILRRRVLVTNRLCREYESSQFDGDIIQFEDYLTKKRRTQQFGRASGMR